jgi:hypothetical protein
VWKSYSSDVDLCVRHVPIIKNIKKIHPEKIVQESNRPITCTHIFLVYFRD